MQDGKVEINTELNTSNVEKNVGKLQQLLGNIQDKLGSLGKSNSVSGLAKLSAVTSGISASFDILSKTIGKAKQAVDQCIDAFNKQKGAEVALSTAAKNNPYLNGQSVKKLKEFASEMQNISAVGDEEILPMMSQLAAAGRTQEEIQNIIRASLDISASGAMSFDSAVRNLNKTFSGLAGELGESVPAIRGLTQEELKQGKAVQVLASQYKGMAESVANTTATQKKLSNTMGDLKEEIGARFNSMIAPANNFFNNIIAGWTNSLRAQREYKNALNNLEHGKATGEDAQTVIERSGYYDYIEQLNKLENKIKTIQEQADRGLLAPDEDQKANQLAAQNLIQEVQNSIAQKKEFLKLEEERYAKAKSVLITETELTKQSKQQAEAQKNIATWNKQTSAEKERQKALNDTASSAINNFNSTMAQFEKEIEVRKKLGEQIDDETYKQEKLAIMTNAYIQARKSAGSTISDANNFSTTNTEEIQNLQKEVDEINLVAKVDLKLNPNVDPKDYEKLAQESKQLLEDANSLEVLAQKAHTDKKFELEKEYQEKVDALKEKSREKEKEAKTAQFIYESQQLESSLQVAADFLEKYSEMTNQIVALQTERIDNETKARQVALEKEYRQGLITEEEYEQKKKEIDKKAAQEKYKLEMWQWTANLATATGSIALGIVNALGNSANPAIGIAMASIIGAMGAVQLANVIAAKPIPPSFSTGGIVGGSSYYGDKVQGNLNSREMILNMGQQKNLFDSINSNNFGNSSPSIVINNSASNIVNAEPVISKNQIELLIDARVNDSLKRGRLNNSLQQANTSMTGTFYGV